MWHPSSKTTYEVKDEKKLLDEDDAAGNVDSGFLSAGNIQYSGEICDSDLLRDKEESGSAPIPPDGTSSSSAAIADDLMKTTDSGIVDVDVSESLSHLKLEQITLNSLNSDNQIHNEPTVRSSECSPNAATHEVLDYVKLLLHDVKQQQQDFDKKCATLKQELTRLYGMQDEDGNTELHITIIHDPEGACALIKLAPDPYFLNIQNDYWQTPLHLAVLTEQPVIVRNLIVAGADPTVRNYSGNTALHLACMRGDLLCTTALTESLTPRERRDALSKHEKRVPALPQNLEQINYVGQTCLHLAALNGHVPVVRHLLRLGANLEEREYLAGRTALHLAIEKKQWPVVTFLLKECSPCLETQTYAGCTAYQLAVSMKLWQLAKELEQLGAKPKLPRKSVWDSDIGSEESSEISSDDSDEDDYND
ncbi:NF-kappa-B inhibitor alpha-like [Pseudomyrmex gracilis]|uniref:NF-kappa-B inhibitor alpha-like n=1 Tax=Pseudomyrmex gracilis TaxID=219809 RepID=UPI000994BC0F|nr:NF-kappa-B inhibitor alpha-like [Pseudomyrmex gracilis]